MIDFMVLAGPRSATTWIANFLTTDTSVCLHDPLLRYTTDQLDRLVIPGKRIGISCTCAAAFPEWVTAHKCPKVVMYRDVEDMNASLRKLKLRELDKAAHLTRLIALDVPGNRWFDWADVFQQKSARALYEHLLPDLKFDPVRHHELVQMRIEPRWADLEIQTVAVAALNERVRKTLEPK